jgi:hypothetical protein
MQGPSRTLTLLLNLAHALDHLFLLIFATAVAAIAPISASRAGRT